MVGTSDRITKATTRGGSDPVVTGLRERLEIVPGEQQGRVAVVRSLVVHHLRRVIAAAFAERICGEIRGAQLLPAPAIDARRRGARGDVLRLALAPGCHTDGLMLRGCEWHVEVQLAR